MQTKSFFSNTSLFAQAYGQGDYSCGNYQQGCSQTTGTQPPNTAAILADPSVAIPGSLVLAVVVALITTTIAKTIRKFRANKNS